MYIFSYLSHAPLSSPTLLHVLEVLSEVSELLHAGSEDHDVALVEEGVQLLVPQLLH